MKLHKLLQLFQYTNNVLLYVGLVLLLLEMLRPATESHERTNFKNVF